MRIAIGLCYEGSPFEGWQSQASGNTVQDHLERALAEVAGAPVRVASAGRTDAGVHAVGQVAHFDTDAARPESAWVRGTNAHLPPEIAVQWAMPVDSEFHSRFSAEARSYRYVLYNHPVRPALLPRHAGWFHSPLDVEAMRRAAGFLVGEHDFSSFRSSECQADSPVRTVQELRMTAAGPYVLFDITANGFLHHMVRNIVGALVYVGAGRESASWIGDLLASRDRTRSAPTFMPDGLYLAAVEYDPALGLPAFPRHPLVDFQ